MLETVNFIIILLSSFLGFYVYCCIYGRITMKPFILTIKNIFLLMLFGFLLTLNSLHNNVYIYTFINDLLIGLCYKCVFKDKWLKTIVNTLLVVICAYLLEPILSVILALITSSVLVLNDMGLMKLLFSTVFCYSFYFLFKNNYVIKITRMIYKIVVNTNKKLLIPLFVLTFVSYYIDISYALNYVDIKYYLLLLVVIIFIIYFSNFVLKVIFNNQLYDVINKHLLNNINLYQQQSDDFRLLKHNLKNDLYSIKVADEDSRNQIIDKVIEKYNMSYPGINNIKNVPTGLQGLIVLKFNEAKSKNINAWFDNNTNDLDKINDKLFLDLCSVVSICIDNAIESAELSFEKVLLIEINNYNDKIEIKIINSFINDIDLDKLGEKNYSTKNRNSGLGLNYIYNIKNNIEINQKVVDNLFFTSILVKK